MAGNRQIYEQAMRQGTNYAWDRKWKKAIAEYQRAIAELPREARAYTALGQALVHVNRLQEALEVYQKAARLTPQDPMALERVAELQEELGSVKGAVQTWRHAADLHLRLRAVDSAVQVWQHLVKVAPQDIPAHENLAKAYAGMGQNHRAIHQYLSLAAIYQEKGDQEQAEAVCQKALELDPRNSDVLTALDALEQGRSLSKLIEKEPGAEFYVASDTDLEMEAEASSLVEMMQQKALTELAGALLEDSDFGDMTLTASLLQGIDCQTRGDKEAAVASYEQALQGGVSHAAIHFNLGLLYQEELRFDKAIEQLEQAVGDSAYALGAHFALGQCLRATQRLDEALPHFIEALEQVDLSTVGPENAGALQQAYGDLVVRYSDSQDRDMAVSFINALVEFLSGEGWEDKLFETRQQLNRWSDSNVIPLAEILTISNYEQVLASMARSQECLAQGMLRTASEECLWAIEHAPGYLPLHLYLSKLFKQGNQVQNAIGKMLFVADTFAARDEMSQAMGLYEQVLSMAPMDLNVRRKLIALLQEHAMIEQALEHRLALADAYYELAQIESSRDEYAEALELASQIPGSQEWKARILHRLADIDMQRLDWRSAIKVYSQLKAEVPEDMQARRRLIELYFNLNRRAKAEKELDELIRAHRDAGELSKALEMVQELVDSRPEEMELHKRAAQLCVETGDKEEAISHLDALGELLLQAGRVDEAVATIKAIVALGPENVDAYRKLLEQIA